MPTAKEYAEAIREANGLVTVAARRLGVSRQAIYSMRDKHKSVAQALDDARERTTDLAEGKLIQQINDGNTTAIIFYLKTQGKHRGYIERQEIENTHKGEIVIDLVELPPPRDASPD